MGTTTSTPAPLAPPFQRMRSWELKSAKKLLQDYKDKDLDFGLDASTLGELLAGDKDWAREIIAAFGSTNGINSVNALALICGVAVVCPGSALEKAGLIFDALDFDATEQISMDEMTIAFLCAARGFCVLSGVGTVPSDEDLESVTLSAYRDLNKTSGQSILKPEFTRWVLKFAGGASVRSSTSSSSAEVSLDSALEQFGIVASTKTNASFDNSDGLGPAAATHDDNNNELSECVTDADHSGDSVAAQTARTETEPSELDTVYQAEQLVQNSEDAEPEYAADEEFERSEEHDDSAASALAMRCNDDADASLPGGNDITPGSGVGTDGAREKEAAVSTSECTVASTHTDDAQEYEQEFADEIPRSADPAALREVSDGIDGGDESIRSNEPDATDGEEAEQYVDAPAAASIPSNSETGLERTDCEVDASLSVEAANEGVSGPLSDEDAAAEIAMDAEPLQSEMTVEMQHQPLDADTSYANDSYDALTARVDGEAAAPPIDVTGDDNLSASLTPGKAAAGGVETEEVKVAEPPLAAAAVNLNDYDAYDYTHAAFNASSGLAPPEDPADFANDDDNDNDKVSDRKGSTDTTTEVATTE